MASPAFELEFKKKTEETVVTPEIAPVEKEALVESAREKRANLLSRIIQNRLVDLISNKLPIPVLDFSKGLVEAALSKTMSGKKLTALDRILWTTMSGLILVSYAMMLSEKFTGINLANEGLAMRTVPMILAAIADYRLLEDKIKQFISDHPQVSDLLTNLTEQLKFWDQRTISLNLSGILENISREQ